MECILNISYFIVSAGIVPLSWFLSFCCFVFILLVCCKGASSRGTLVTPRGDIFAPTWAVFLYDIKLGLQNIGLKIHGSKCSELFH